ncbi:MAG: hypothetical protein RIR33_3612 [Pseudomonadota bacterium]|jgi:hypothetical protein
MFSCEWTFRTFFFDWTDWTDWITLGQGKKVKIFGELIDTGNDAKKIVKRLPCGCLVAGTLVVTPTGTRPIEEIAVGDLVLSWEEETGRIEMRPVTSLVRTEPKLIWSIQVRNAHGGSSTFEATDDHPWQVRGIGWVDTKDLRAGQMLATANKRDAQILAVFPTIRLETSYNLSVKGFNTF